MKSNTTEKENIIQFHIFYHTKLPLIYFPLNFNVCFTLIMNLSINTLAIIHISLRKIKNYFISFSSNWEIQCSKKLPKISKNYSSSYWFHNHKSFICQLKKCRGMIKMGQIRWSRVGAKIDLFGQNLSPPNESGIRAVRDIWHS